MTNITTNMSSLSSASSSAQGTPSAGNSMYQIGGSPAAVLFTVASAMGDAILKNMEISSQVAMAQTNVQRDTIIAGAAAQIAAANKQSWATFMQGIGELSSAATSAVMGVVQTRQSQEPLTKMGEAQTKLQSPKALNDYTPTQADIIVGGVPPAGTPIATRYDAFVRGNYEGVTLVADPANPGKMILDPISRAAINHMDAAAYNQFKDKLGIHVDSMEKAVNTWATEQQTLQGKLTQVTQMITGASNFATKLTESSFTADAGKEQALQQSLSGVQQLAAGVANASNQEVIAALDKFASALRAAIEGSRGN